MVNVKEDAGGPLLLAPPAWLLLAVSLLAAVEAFGLLRRNWLLLWPGVLLLAGAAGAARAAQQAARLGVPPRRWLGEARLFPALLLAGLALAGGLGEVLRAAGVLPGPLSFIWPLCLLALGGVLLAAPGPGQAARIGLLVLLAGLLRGFEAAFGIQPGAVGTGWFVVLAYAAVRWLRAARPADAGEDQ